jgi:2-keto-4-pentenoate hydratase
MQFDADAKSVARRKSSTNTVANLSRYRDNLLRRWLSISGEMSALAALIGEESGMHRISERKRAARLLANDRLSLAPIELAEECRPVDETDGYEYQVAVNRHLYEAGLGDVVGHKIGCTTPVMQSFLGILSPCAGDIFACSVHPNRAVVRRSDYVRLGAECEIAVALSRDIVPGEAPFTRATVTAAVGAVMAAIEIVDDRYRDYRAVGVPTLIADNFFNAGCVLGDPVKDWHRLDLAQLEGTSAINGREVGRGRGAMVLGHPLEALAWLANSRADRGLSLKAGHFVLLGSLVETKWLNAGDHFAIDIEALGALELTVDH